MITPALADALERAAALQQAGDVLAAERCYKDILAVEPRQFDALHCLGVLEAQHGRYEEATISEQRLRHPSARVRIVLEIHHRTVSFVRRGRAKHAFDSGTHRT